jgi:hypothetical protein
MPIPLFRETVEGGFFQHTPPESLKDTEIIRGQALTDLAGWGIWYGTCLRDGHNGESLFFACPYFEPKPPEFKEIDDKMGTLHGIDGETARQISEAKQAYFSKKIDNSNNLELGQQWHGMYGKIIYTVIELTATHARVSIDHQKGKGLRYRWFRRTAPQFYELITKSND